MPNKAHVVGSSRRWWVFGRLRLSDGGPEDWFFGWGGDSDCVSVGGVGEVVKEQGVRLLTGIGRDGGAEGRVDFGGVRSRVAERGGGVRLCGWLGWLGLDGRLALG